MRWTSLIAIILAPSLLAIAAVTWLAIATGALLSPEGLAEAQQRDPRLVVLPDGIQYWAPLKAARVSEEQPDIVSIGSSRCQELRSAMLKPYRVFNACLSAWTLEQHRDMLRRVLASSHPRIVILELDYFLFTDAWAEANRDRSPVYGSGMPLRLQGMNDVLQTLYRHRATFRPLIPDLLFQPQYEPVDHNRLLTLDAIRVGGGFRYDGSFLFPAGSLLQAPKEARDIMNPSIGAFPGAPSISQRQFAILEDIAEIARRSGVTLIGIQLPYVEQAVAYLDSEPSYAPYRGNWIEFESDAMKARLAAIDIHFFDMARDPINRDPRYFINASHPGEAGTLAVLVHLLDDPAFRALLPDLDAEQMRTTLAATLAKGEFFHVYHDVF